jgi:hypothetical protein
MAGGISLFVVQQVEGLRVRPSIREDRYGRQAVDDEGILWIVALVDSAAVRPGITMTIRPVIWLAACHAATYYEQYIDIIGRR